MKRFKKVLIITGILLCVLIFVGGAWDMNKKEYRETFSVKPGTVLKVFNKNGNIVVNSWDRDYVEVEALIQRHLWTVLLKEPTIDVTTGNELVVRTLYSSTLSQAIPVQYRILAPKGVLVAQVETSTGRINVDEVSGDVDAKTSTGDIQIHKVNGLVKAVTSCGKINVNEVSGDADARTSTGGIQLHKVDGFVKAVTSCGNIDITGIGGLSGARTDNGKISVEVPAIRDNLEIRSSNGGITVFLSQGVAAQLEVSTSNGQITYGDLPLTVTESSKKKFTGKLGEGGGRINIKTSNGSINLKKLDGSSLNNL